MASPRVIVQPLPTREVLREWVGSRTAPRVTVYLPLQRAIPEAKQNAVLLEQAAREVAQRLVAKGLPAERVARWTERLRTVDTGARQDHLRPAGLAMLLDERALLAYGLPEPPPFGVSVANTFALRPLLRAISRAMRYRVLAVSAKRVALFEGGPEGLAVATRPGLPVSLEGALGTEKTQPELRVRGTGAAGRTPVYYSHGSGADERKRDLLRFHQALARALAAELEDEGVPLVLAGTEEHQGGLRALAASPCLVGEALPGNPDRLAPQALHERAWPIIQRWLDDRVQGTSWERARNAGKGLDLIDDIGAAALAGRVRRLWLDAERSLPGRLDAETGRAVEGDGDDDVLEALADLVVTRGGEVLPVSPERLPSATGAAAELH